jgi:hypothetical protein
MKRILSENGNNLGAFPTFRELKADFTLGQGYFKPWATSTPVLLLLLFFTSILIVLAELACRSIPEHSGYGQYKDGGNTTLRRDLTDTRNEVPPGKFDQTLPLPHPPNAPPKIASSNVTHQCCRTSSEEALIMRNCSRVNADQAKFLQHAHPPYWHQFQTKLQHPPLRYMFNLVGFRCTPVPCIHHQPRVGFHQDSQSQINQTRT